MNGRTRDELSKIATLIEKGRFSKPPRFYSIVEQRLVSIESALTMQEANENFLVDIDTGLVGLENEVNMLKLELELLEQTSHPLGETLQILATSGQMFREFIKRLDPITATNLCSSSKSFRERCKQAEVWKLLFNRDFKGEEKLSNESYFQAYQRLLKGDVRIDDMQVLTIKDFRKFPQQALLIYNDILDFSINAMKKPGIDWLDVQDDNQDEVDQAAVMVIYLMQRELFLQDFDDDIFNDVTSVLVNIDLPEEFADFLESSEMKVAHLEFFATTNKVFEGFVEPFTHEDYIRVLKKILPPPDRLFRWLPKAMESLENPPIKLNDRDLGIRNDILKAVLTDNLYLWIFNPLNEAFMSGMLTAWKDLRKFIMDEGYEEISEEISEEAIDGGCRCFENIKGFINRRSSCFMDSTLMAMFSVKESPFYQAMIIEDINLEGAPLVCDEDFNEDRALRREVQELLREDIEQIHQGERVKCTVLRNVLGKVCRINIKKEQNLSKGEHDPSEFYERLVSIMNYNPMIISDEVFRARDNFGLDSKLTSQQTFTANKLTLRADHTNFIKWPQTWENPYFEAPPPKGVLELKEFIYTKSRINFVEAEVIVVHLDRSVGDFGGFESVFERDETELNEKNVPVDDELIVFGITYRLCTVVYSPFEAHWATLIRCSGQWLNYDDTFTKEPISMRKVKNSHAENLINTRGLMFFYYRVEK